MSPSQQRRFRYDVFISYSHRNQEWVRGWLVPQLKDAGLRVCIDHESFEPGAPSITEMERAVLQSRKTVLVLTPEYLQSAWAEFENILVQTIDPAARDRRLIPVLFIPCTLPLRIGSLTYIDFTRSAEHEENIERLITTLRRRLAPRRKPQVATTINLSFEVPTGAMSLDSPFYIEREYDRVIQQQVMRAGSTTLVEGARQMGKSSLLARALTYARAQQSMIDADNAESGPFADHLEHYRGRLIAAPELQQAMRQVLRNGNCPTFEVFLQLRALGLVMGSDHRAATPKCRLYAAYFQRVLL